MNATRAAQYEHTWEKRCLIKKPESLPNAAEKWMEKVSVHSVRNYIHLFMCSTKHSCTTVFWAGIIHPSMERDPLIHNLQYEGSVLVQ